MNNSGLNVLLFINNKKIVANIEDNLELWSKYVKPTKHKTRNYLQARQYSVLEENALHELKLLSMNNLSNCNYLGSNVGWSKGDDINNIMQLPTAQVLKNMANICQQCTEGTRL